jgi:hypothetical protein
VIDYNPSKVHHYDLLYAFGSRKVNKLGFDPLEWTWHKLGSMKARNFFLYSIKKGYRIIIQTQYKQLRFDRWIEVSGYSFQQRRLFFKRLWHHWMPRKISSMVWLVIAEGLPIGAWRMWIGHSGLCTLCRSTKIQTWEHAFFGCPIVKEAWERLRCMRNRVWQPLGLVDWNMVIYGELGRPHPPGQEHPDSDTL